jgi:hypothetical protein
VVLRQERASASPKEDWFRSLQRIRATREATGYPFMNETATNEHVEEMREGDRIDQLLQEVDEQQRKSGPA